MTNLKPELLNLLQHRRAELVEKLAGLSEYEQRRPRTPTGTNLLGLIKHLAGIEYGYLGEALDHPPHARRGSASTPLHAITITTATQIAAISTNWPIVERRWSAGEISPSASSNRSEKISNGRPSVATMHSAYSPATIHSRAAAPSRPPKSSIRSGSTAIDAQPASAIPSGSTRVRMIGSRQVNTPVTANKPTITPLASPACRKNHSTGNAPNSPTIPAE
nr:DUF664 domain-containing protein [Kribbella solani]